MSAIPQGNKETEKQENRETRKCDPHFGKHSAEREHVC